MNFQNKSISSINIIRIRTHKLGSQSDKLFVPKSIWTINWRSAIASLIRRWFIFPRLCLIPKIDTACFFKSYWRLSIVGMFFFLAAIGSQAQATEPLTLQQALQYTADRNPALEALRYEEKAAEGLVEQAGYRPNPMLSTQIEDFGGTGSHRRGVDSLEPTIQASLTLERGGKRERRVALAEREQEIVAFEFMVSRNVALLDTAIAYIKTLENQERIDLASEQLLLVEATKKAVDVRLEVGASSPADAARARVTLASAQIEFSRAQAAFAATRSRLAATWGGLSSEISTVSGNLSGPLEMPSKIEYSVKLGNHPLITLQKSIVESRRANLELEQAYAVQDMTVEGGVRFFQDGTEAAFLTGVSIPLPVRHKNQGNIRAAREILAGAEYSYQAVEFKLRATFNSAWQDLAAAHIAVGELRNKAIPAVEEAHASVREAYVRGQLPLISVLDAQRTLTSLHREFLDAKGAYAVALINVEALSDTSFASVSSLINQP
jgi:cobalt-zinc-cadmium efflux system outer membrane protein